MVERFPPKEEAAGSIPVSRSVHSVHASPCESCQTRFAGTFFLSSRRTNLKLADKQIQRPAPSTRTYFALVAILAILAAINVFLPQGIYSPLQQLPAPKPVLALVNAATMLVVYGGLGFIGLRLSRRLGFAEIWDPKVSNRQRFLFPALTGVGIGVFFILADGIFSRFHTLGRLPHPPFPTSLVVSAIAGIGEEMIFRLFFIPFWVWLISHVIFKKRWQDQVFAAVAVLSALAFAAGHIPSTLIILSVDTVQALPAPLLLEIFLLNGILSLFAAFHFRKHGFLAAVGIHFWTDVVWHVVYGVI